MQNIESKITLLKFVLHSLFCGIVYIEFSVEKNYRLQGKIIITGSWLVFNLYLAHASEQDVKSKTVYIEHFVFAAIFFSFAKLIIVQLTSSSKSLLNP